MDAGLAAVIGAAVGVVGAGGVAVITTRANRAEGDKDRTHQREMAREERNQDRILRAYQVLQEYAAKWTGQASWFIRTSHGYSDPEPADITVAADAVAMASLQSSPAVVEEVKRFNTCLVVLSEVKRDVEAELGQPYEARIALVRDHGVAPLNDSERLEAFRDASRAVLTAGDALNVLMRKELGWTE